LLQTTVMLITELGLGLVLGGAGVGWVGVFRYLPWYVDDFNST
jgi:hypothetical protein